MRKRSSLLAAGVVLAAVGCGGGPPDPPDKGEAVAALRTALEGWQRGDKPEALPAIRVVDPDWARGARLTRFEIDEGQAQPAGYDMGVPVKLWLEEGRKNPRPVKYTITTRPAVVVVRDFGG
jgi:hypothetical protein